MTFLARAFLKWLPLGVAITLVCALLYATVQQNYRTSLNDPQIQMAEDAAIAVGNGASVQSVVPVGNVDLEASLAPWVAVYDANGNELASSGELNSAPPKLPQGVFDISTWHSFAEDGIKLQVPQNENRFTWQPQPDVRQAVVLVHASNGDFVASGRNMREVENREGALTLMVGIGWAVTMLATFVTQGITSWML
jgi:hypothetical protein